MYAREKLAQIELKGENYLKAALQFEAILDFIQAEGCYEKARDSPEKFEQNGDFILRKGGEVGLVKELYLKAVSYLRKNPVENEGKIKKLFKKIHLCAKVQQCVMDHFLKLSEDQFPIFPQSKVIKEESIEIVDGEVDLSEIEDDPPGQKI